MNTKDTRETITITSERHPTEPQIYSLVRHDKLGRQTLMRLET